MYMYIQLYTNKVNIRLPKIIINIYTLIHTYPVYSYIISSFARLPLLNVQ